MNVINKREQGNYPALFDWRKERYGMYMLTNKQWDAIEDVVYRLLSEITDFKSLTTEQQERIIRCDIAMVEAYKKRKRANERTAIYIANKRLTNKNYARKRKESK